MLNSYIFCVMTTRFSRCTNTSRKIYDFLLTEKILKVHKKNMSGRVCGQIIK